jgi:hypothetical protein
VDADWCESDFARLLQLRFPKARVLSMDASRLTDMTRP